MVKYILSVFLSLSAFFVSAQDLTGIWRGGFQSSANRLQLMGQEDRYKFELQLDQRDKTFSGVTYSYKTTVFYGKASCSGAINKTTKKVLLEELKIVEVRMIGGDACIMTCFLQYSKSGDEEFLEGTYTSMNTRDSTNCGKGTVFLRKVPTSDFYEEPFLVEREKEKEKEKELKKNEQQADKPAIAKTEPKKSSPTTSQTPKKATTKSSTTPKKNNTAVAKSKPPVTPPPARVEKDIVKVVPTDSIRKTERPIVPTTIPTVLATRENELVKTITTSANSITINIYDNGTIDNDTVSVYLDKRLVISSQKLTEKPLSVTFPLNDDDDHHELVMVAENLGEIPPNTSLMVVKAGTQQYEVRITSTEQKNAVVLFKYQKPH